MKQTHIFGFRIEDHVLTENGFIKYTCFRDQGQKDLMTMVYTLSDVCKDNTYYFSIETNRRTISFRMKPNEKKIVEEDIYEEVRSNFMALQTFAGLGT